MCSIVALEILIPQSKMICVPVSQINRLSICYPFSGEERVSVLCMVEASLVVFRMTESKEADSTITDDSTTTAHETITPMNRPL